MKRFALLLAVVLSLTVAGVRAQAAAGTSAAAVDALAAQTHAAQSTQGDDRQGTIKTVHGEVALVQGQTRRAAVEGGPVRQGEQIVTGADSSAAVTLRDGTVVSVGPNSAAELSQYRFNPTTDDGNIALALLKGSLRVVTGLITHGRSENDPARVKVTTPTAVIGIRGTDVIVTADD